VLIATHEVERARLHATREARIVAGRVHETPRSVPTALQAAP
jgi:hypothetical protein